MNLFRKLALTGVGWRSYLASRFTESKLSEEAVTMEIAATAADLYRYTNWPA